jgi:hypothetical protein
MAEPTLPPILLKETSPGESARMDFKRMAEEASSLVRTLADQGLDAGEALAVLGYAAGFILASFEPAKRPFFAEFLSDRVGGALIAGSGMAPCPVASCRLPAGHTPPCAGPGMGGGLIVARHIVNHGTITFGSISGEPTFTLSAPEARLLRCFIDVAHLDGFTDAAEDEAWGHLTGRLHAFLVGRKLSPEERRAEFIRLKPGEVWRKAWPGEDWAPNYPGDKIKARVVDMRDGTCKVWVEGMDDTAMERDGLTRPEADQLLRDLPEPLPREWLEKKGFRPG